MLFIIRRMPIIVLFIILFNNILLAKEDYINVYVEEIKTGGYYIYADNKQIIPCFIKIEFGELINLEPSVKLPYQTVLKSSSIKNLILTLKPAKSDESYSFKYNFMYNLGDPDAKPDDAAVYLFPFEHGRKYHLSQGNNSSLTHFNENKYAFDFEMDIGTPIAAARDGIVVETKSDSIFGGPEDSYIDYANYVLIYHSDGTFGNYAHLKQNGALVKPGDKIKAGDIIGYSGNTGKSSGPHLHFDVRVAAKEGVHQSIPIKFLNYDGKAFLPEEGEYYYSYHPGKPKFEIKLGKNITNKNYENYSAAADLTDKVKIRNEIIDDTIVFFVQNGFNGEKKVKIGFKLKNMIPSNPVPINIMVPPKKELFILFLRKENIKDNAEYSCEYSYEAVER
jgi:murein DD-endopeptidase MepM/ murein hydrolase activator NlpD